MEGNESSNPRRGPPSKRRTTRSPEHEAQDDEWYGDVVDQSEEKGFGGFSVKRPQMSSTDQVESQQLERYFEETYHKKSGDTSETIEDDWGFEDTEFNFSDLLNGYRTVILGVQSFMFALPMILLSSVLVYAGNSANSSMANSTGSFLNIVLVFLAICATTIALIQMVVSAVNQSLRERQIAKDGADIPVLGWSTSLQFSAKIFAEVFFTFLLIWMIGILGLYLLVGGMPDLSMPSIDSDNISAGTVFYMLGSAGSLFAMIGIIPYSIEATVKRS